MDPLVKLALVGTANARVEQIAPGDGHPADELFCEAPTDEAEHVLLLRAGAQAVCERAGYVALEGIARPPAAGIESGPQCSDRLVGVLANALADSDKGLLGEFLTEMASIGLRLPAELLPKALSIGDETA